ncbi:MAG: RNA methyltransferase [Ignavibacteriae bacterium HGW-Ignavibacteriae-3]|nr:MAG: RNA methyltransferase [Ignavibacteriae bacterium HGW-Ignavibacteriae-3]
MAYDEMLANRVRAAFAGIRNIEEKKMMGGLTFMVNGKMCVGILKDDLMCRIDPEIYESALEMKGCREMDFTKRPMKGFVFVNSDGFTKKKDFDFWINSSLEYNKKIKSTPKGRKK